MNEQPKQEPQSKDLLSEALKQGAVPEGYRQIEVDWYEFKNEGDTLAGKLLEKNSVTMAGNRVGRYTVITGEGRRTAFLGSTQLDEKLKLAGLGSEIIIKYTATQKTARSGFDMKLFDVWVK